MKLLRHALNQTHALLLFAVLVNGFFLWHYVSAYASGAPGFASNFPPFYDAATQIGKGLSPYCLSCSYRDWAHYVPFLNPPPLLLFLWPLHGLGYHAAYVLFAGAQLALWVAVLLAPGTRALLPKLAASPRYYVAAALVLPAAYAIYNIFYGQTALLYAALTLLGAGWLRTRPMAAGMAFGVLICKPQLALMVPVLLLAGRQWKALIACGATALLLIGLSGALFGWGLWAEWAKVMQIHQAMLQAEPTILQFYSQVSSLYGGARIAGQAPPSAFMVQLATTLAMAAVLARSAWRAPSSGPTLELFFAATLAATPYLLGYDTVLFGILLLRFIAPPSLQRGLFSQLPLAVLVGLLIAYPVLMSLFVPLFKLAPFSAALMLATAGLVCWRNWRAA